MAEEKVPPVSITNTGQDIDHISVATLGFKLIFLDI